MRESGMFTELKCGCIVIAQPLKQRIYVNRKPIPSDEMNYVIVRRCDDECDHREDRTCFDIRSLPASELRDSKPIEEAFESKLIGELCLMAADAFRFRRIRRVLKEAIG